MVAGKIWFSSTSPLSLLSQAPLSSLKHLSTHHLSSLKHLSSTSPLKHLFTFSPLSSTSSSSIARRNRFLMVAGKIHVHSAEEVTWWWEAILQLCGSKIWLKKTGDQLCRNPNSDFVRLCYLIGRLMQGLRRTRLSSRCMQGVCSNDSEGFGVGVVGWHKHFKPF